MLALFSKVPKIQHQKMLLLAFSPGKSAFYTVSVYDHEFMIGRLLAYDHGSDYDHRSVTEIAKVKVTDW